MLRLKLKDLRRGHNELSLRPSAEALDLDAAMYSNIIVDGTVEVLSGRLIARFDASADVLLTCDRTLVEFVQRVSGSYVVLFTAADPESVSEEYDDVVAFSPADQEIDLTDAVRDTLVLALPARRIAPGADDVEIPHRFADQSDEDDIDPRWDALRGLQN